jgi:glycosyltransferase involved in cell wall biosynthesis
MHQKKRVLILSPQPFFIPRGTPINVREIILSLSEADYLVTLLAYPFGDNLKIKNLEIIRSSNFPFIKNIKAGPSVAKILLDILFFLNAIKLVLSKKFDVIHGIEEGGLMAGALAIILKKPYVFDVDSSMSSQLQESGFISSKMILKAFEKVEAFFMRRAASVITVCTALSEDVKRICPDANISQIEDFPIDDLNESDSTSINLRSTYNITQNEKILLYAGNLEPYQGIDLLLKSYAIVKTRKDLPLSKLVIVGGSEKDISKYKSLSKQLNIDDSLVFTGILAPTLMSAVHSQADVLASPRISGTNTPLKIYGYMNSGKPILATNILSHTQVLNDKNSYLAEADPDSFAKIVAKAISDEPNLVSERINLVDNSLELIKNKYSRKRFHTDIQTVYASIFKVA